TASTGSKARRTSSRTATSCTFCIHEGIPAWRRLRMRFPGLAPIRLVELLRAAPGNRQRIPLVPSMDPGALNGLARGGAGVAEGALERQRHGVRLAADHDGPCEIVRLKTEERLQQTGPASLPELQDFRAAAEGVHKLIVPIAPWLLAIRRQEVRPARDQ